MPIIIQNAYYIPERDQYLISSHVHDFSSVTLSDGKEFFIDGGREYFRSGGSFVGIKTDRIVDFRLTLDDSFTEKIVYKLLWGTRGKEGNKPLKYYPMASFETDHLQAILDNCLNAGQLYRYTAQYWIYKRKASIPCPTPSLISTPILS